MVVSGGEAVVAGWAFSVAEGNAILDYKSDFGCRFEITDGMNVKKKQQTHSDPRSVRRYQPGNLQ